MELSKEQLWNTLKQPSDGDCWNCAHINEVVHPSGDRSGRSRGLRCLAEITTAQGSDTGCQKWVWDAK